MNVFFIDKYTNKERALRTEHPVWGGHTNDIFINAVDMETKKKGTYITEEVYVKIPILSWLTLKRLLV